MPQNFLACDREQELLLPPSLREGLAEDHFAWSVIEAVGELDLAPFFAAYRADGHGRAAHDPAMMVYAYAILEQAAEIDAAEDEQFGDRRGDELPPALSTREGRQLWLRDAQRRLDQRRADAIAAAVTISSAEFGQLEPMVAATETELAASGVTDTPEVVLADAGYWHSEQIERLTAAAPSCSSRPTPASARAPGRAGTAVCTRSCAACSRPNAAASSTADATS